jgi:plasmid stability protein
MEWLGIGKSRKQKAEIEKLSQLYGGALRGQAEACAVAERRGVLVQELGGENEKLKVRLANSEGRQQKLEAEHEKLYQAAVHWEAQANKLMDGMRTAVVLEGYELWADEKPAPERIRRIFSGIGAEHEWWLAVMFKLNQHKRLCQMAAMQANSPAEVRAYNCGMAAGLHDLEVDLVRLVAAKDAGERVKEREKCGESDQ